MLGEWTKRPSLLVCVWTLVVVAAFVLRGDLRLSPAAGPQPADATPAPAPARDEPIVVRRPAAARTAPAVVRRGRVFDALGFLVVGAEVLPMARPAVRTDADGGFTLEHHDGLADALVRAEGLRPAWLRSSAGSPDPLVLQLEPAAPWDQPPTPLSPAPVLFGEGHLRRADGTVLAGAFVTAAGTGLWSRSDEHGRYVLPLAAASATLLLHDPGSGSDSGLAADGVPFLAPRAQGRVPLPDVVAAPAASIRGIVRDPAGSPVAGVPVQVRGPLLQRVVETGNGGAFRLGGLLPGPYELTPLAYRGAFGRAHALGVAGGAVDVDLQLVAAAEARLRVVDEQGHPAVGVYVTASVGGLRRGIAMADGDGAVDLPVAAGAEFEVRLPPHFGPLPVRRFDAAPPTLVVAGP